MKKAELREKYLPITAEGRLFDAFGLFRDNAPPDRSAPVQRTSVYRSESHKYAGYLYNSHRSLFSPAPAIHATVMTYNPTPRLSSTTSIESIDSLMTPNYGDTSTFVDDFAVNEGVPDSHFFLFKNSSEVWEEFKGAGCDPFGISVADAGIPISPSSSLLSGIDLLGDTSSPPLPEVTAVPIRSGSHQMAIPRRASLFDFPSPPTLVPNRRIMRMGGPKSISGSPPIQLSLASHPSRGTSHEQPIRHSKHSALQRWSTLPSVAFHPDTRRESIELVTNKATDMFQTRASKCAFTGTDAPVAPVSNLPFVAISSLSLRPAGYDVPSPVHHSRRRKVSDTFTSFIDMSANTPTLSTSRVHKLFSKISSGLRSRGKRH